MPTLESLAAARLGGYSQAARRAPLLTPEEEDSLLNDLLSPVTSTVGYISETFAKPARVLYALPSGNPRELLNAVPFSDTLGLTDPAQMATASGALENLGVLPENEPGFDALDIPRFAIDVLGDPVSWGRGFMLGSNVLTRAGDVVEKIGAFPKRSIIGAGQELIEPVRTTRMTKTLREQLGNDAGLWKNARDAATAQGDNLDDLLDQRMATQFGIGPPVFGRAFAQFNLPYGEKIAETLDRIGHGVRVSPLGAQTARLFSYGARGGAEPEIQQAATLAGEAAESEIFHATAQTAKDAADLRAAGLDPMKYRTAMRNARERTFYDTAATEVDEAGRRITFPKEKVSVDESVERNFPDVTPEQRALLKTAITRDIGAANRELDAIKARGMNAGELDEPAVEYAHRKGTQPLVERGGKSARSMETREPWGPRREYAKNTPATLIDDVMSDKSLYQDAVNLPERPIELAPRDSDIATLQQAQFEDIEELARYQAASMAQAARAGKPIDRTIVPPIPKPEKAAWNAAAKRVLEEKMGWTEQTWDYVRNLTKELRELRAAADAGDDIDNAFLAAKQAELDTYTVRVEQARELISRLSQVPAKNIEAGLPFYGNEPFFDSVVHTQKQIERRHFFDQAVFHLLRNAERFGGLNPPEGHYNLLKVLEKMDAGGDDAARTAFAKFYAPEMQKIGLIDADELERIVGAHAVVSSGMESMSRLDEVADLVPKAALKRAKAAVEFPQDGLNILSHIAVPKNLVDDAAHVYSKFTAPVDLGWWTELWDKWSNTFKVHVTTPFLSFLSRNKSGSLWNSVASDTRDPRLGYTPSAYAKPVQVSAKVLAGETLEKADVPPHLAHLSPAEATVAFRAEMYAAGLKGQGEALERTGMVGGGGFYGETGDLASEIPGTLPDPRHFASLRYYGQGILDTLTGKASRDPRQVPGGFMQAANEGGKLFGLVKGGMEGNAYIERLHRGATLWAKLMQGYAPDVASGIANAAHVDYKRLSPFNRNVSRRIFPFFTWTAAVVPMTLKRLLDQPGSLTGVAARGLSDMQEEGFTPQQLQGTLAIPLGGQDAEGNQTFLSQLDLPFETLNKTFKAGGGGILGALGGTLRSIAGQTNPLLAAVPELATGKSLFFGRNLEDTDPLLQRLAGQVGAMEPGQLSIADYAAAKSPFSRYLTTARTLLDSRKGYADRILGLTTGARLPTVDMSKARGVAIGQTIKDTMRDLGGKSTEIVNISQEAAEKLPIEKQKRVAELKQLIRAQAKRARALAE